MSGGHRPADSRPPHAGAGGFGMASLMASPVLIGGLLTFGFYAAIPYLPLEQELVQRYFCGHWIEYVTTTLFFVGMTILVKKGMRLGAENRSLASDPLARIPPGSDDIDATLDAIDREVRAVPASLRGTQLLERIADVCGYLRSRRTATGLEDYLKYRAELALAALNESYAVVRTVTWAIPILGFLGTVIGITMAIANLKPEQLANSLNEVTGGLAVAFDTTALSLGLSLIIVFTSFVIDRSEQKVLGEVEEYGIRRLAPLFPTDPPEPLSLPEAGTEAAQRLMERTERLIERQAAVWEEALDEMRARWTESLTQHRAAFDEALQLGLEGVLSDHAAKLADTRSEFLSAFELAAQTLETGLTKSAAAQEHAGERIGERLDAAVAGMAEALAIHGSQHTERLQTALAGLERQSAHLTEQMQAGVETNRELLDELRRQADVLLQIVAKEEDLGRLQTRLTENLESLQSVERLDEALHSLSAAVHLMTARARPKAA